MFDTLASMQAVKERDDTRAELDALRAEFSKSIDDRQGLQADASKQKDSLANEIHQVCPASIRAYPSRLLSLSFSKPDDMFTEMALVVYAHA